MDLRSSGYRSDMQQGYSQGAVSNGIQRSGENGSGNYAYQPRSSSGYGARTTSDFDGTSVQGNGASYDGYSNGASALSAAQVYGSQAVQGGQARQQPYQSQHYEQSPRTGAGPYPVQGSSLRAYDGTGPSGTSSLRASNGDSRTSYQQGQLSTRSSTQPDYDRPAPSLLEQRSTPRAPSLQPAPNPGIVQTREHGIQPNPGVGGGNASGSAEEEVRRLQKLLSRMSAELGGQLSSSQRGAEMDPQTRADWLQKMVLQLEARQAMQEGELRESKAQARRAARQAEAAEQENNSLREQQARTLRESRSGGGGNVGGEEVRQLQRDRDTLRAQYEELQNRHGILQRSLQLVDEQKTAEARGAAESSRRVAEMEMRQSSLVNQTNLLTKENQILREQLKAELSRFEVQRMQLMQQRDGIQVSHEAELKEQEERAAKLQQDLQALHDQSRAQMEAMTSKWQEDSRAMYLQMHEGDSKRAELVEKLKQEQQQIDRLRAQLEAREAQAENVGREIGRKDAALLRSVLQAERQADERARSFLLTRVVARWHDESVDRAARLQMAHALFAKVGQHWGRKFYKNHFLAWKFVWSRARAARVEISAKTQRACIRAAFDTLTLEARSAARDAHLAALAAEREAALVSQEGEITAKLTALKEAAVAQRSAEAAGERAAALQVSADERSASEDALRRDAAAAAAAAEEKLAATVEAHEKRMAELQVAHAAEIAALQSALDTATRQAREDLDAATAAHAAAADKAAAERAASESALEKAHAESEALLRSAAEQREAELQAAMAQGDEAHAAAMAQLAQDRVESERELRAARAVSEEELRAQARRTAEMHAAALQTADATAKEREADLRREHDAERSKLQNNIAAKQAEMEAALSQAADAKEALETELRAQIVAENKSWNRQVEELHEEHSKQQREWRKKALDKDREHAAKLEELERVRLQAEDDFHQQVLLKQQEGEHRVADLKKEHSRELEELRQKGMQKEREAMAKLEATRADNLRAQEEWQLELQEKDAELQRKLDAKQRDFQTHLDSLLSGKVNAAIQELQEKLSAQEEAGNAAETAIATYRTKELELKQRLGTAQASEERLRQELELLRAEQEREGSAAAQLREQHQKEQEATDRLRDELASARQSMTDIGRRAEAAERRATEAAAAQAEAARQAEEALAQAEAAQRQGRLWEEGVQTGEKELLQLREEKNRLADELAAASQALLKRGDDFSESVRLLQKRLETSDGEARDARAKLLDSQRTNARLASELEDSTRQLQRYSTLQLAEPEAADRARLLEERLEVAEGGRRAAEEQRQQLQIALDAARQESWQAQQALKGRATDSAELEALLQERERLEQQLTSVMQENETLTSEMDTILVENAHLRERADEAAERAEAASDAIEASATRLSTPRVTRQRARPITYPAGRLGATCGVHTSRLLRAVFAGWLEAVLNRRIGGTNDRFRCLENFVDTDGSLARWFVAGRLRKHDVDVKGDRVGSGSFAEVFKGELRLTCAVKRMRGPMNKKEIAEFVREGEMMRLVNHPNVVKLMGVHIDGAQSYNLVLEYVQGCNLFDYLHKFHRTVPIGKQLQIAVQICDAMVCIHSWNIVHRDVKPQNVIYQEKSGLAKLCDFGLARLMPPGVNELDPTQLGTGGTPAYQGPEILRRQPVGQKLDLYGFAVTLWEMYTARLPWSDCNLEQMVRRVSVQDERPPLPTDMPREYAEIIAASWNRDPWARPAFEALLPPLQDLHAVLAGGSKSSSQGSSSSVSTNVSSASTLAGRVAAPSRLQPPPRMMTGQPGGKGGPSIYGPF